MKNPEAQILKLPQADVQYFPAFFSKNESGLFLDELLRKIAWQTHAIRIFGKLRDQPRLSAWYGDPGTAYTYSGKRFEPLPWIAVLKEIKARIEPSCGIQFNSVLANRYRNGRDSMGVHSDDEKELGKNPVIGSVSFGEPRIFRLRHRIQKELKHDLELQDGSLLIMKGPTQHYWKHEVPKSTRVLRERINLTFRRILKP